MNALTPERQEELRGLLAIRRLAGMGAQPTASVAPELEPAVELVLHLVDEVAPLLASPPPGRMFPHPEVRGLSDRWRTGLERLLCELGPDALAGGLRVCDGQHHSTYLVVMLGHVKNAPERISIYAGLEGQEDMDALHWHWCVPDTEN